MRQRNLVTLVTVALAIVLGSTMALADNLNITGGYNGGIQITGDGLGGTYGGGTFTGGYLNGTMLPWIYCVDIPDEVGVPGNYPNAIANHNGTIAGSDGNNNKGGLTGYTNGNNGTQAGVHNAIDVAWLLQYAAGGATTYDLQVGLQGAIWHVIYGVTLTGCSDGSGCVTAYNNDLAALAAAGNNIPDYTANFTWLSPSGNSSSVDQGLITQLVPDGGMTLILLGGALVGLGGLRRKLRA